MKKKNLINWIVLKTIKYIIFILLAFLIRGFVQFGANDIAGEGSFEDLFLEIVGFTTIMVSYFSLTRSFVIYDAEYRKCFFEGDQPRFKIKAKVKFLITSVAFWLEIAMTLAFVAILPLKFGYVTLVNALMHWNEEIVVNGKLLPILILFSLILLLTFFAHLSALNWWIATHRTSKKEKPRAGALLKSVFGVAGIYCCGALVLPIVLSVFLTIFNVFGNITTVIILLFLVLILFGVGYTRAFWVRKKFLTQLVVLCQANGFTLSKVDAGYRSLLFLTRKENFCITRDGRTYACKLICGVRKLSPMYLDENGNAKIVHRFALGRFELLQYVTAFQYAFDSAEQKIVIINPIPQSVSVSCQGSARPIDTGEKIKDYHIYNATGFLNALERDCLCK